MNLKLQNYKHASPHPAQVLQRHEVRDRNLSCVLGHSRKNRDRLFGRCSNNHAAERNTWAEREKGSKEQLAEQD